LLSAYRADQPSLPPRLALADFGIPSVHVLTDFSC